MKKAEHVCDTLPTEQLYRTVSRAPGSKVKHTMLKHRSLRCESHLESWHLKLSNFANTNSGKGLADYLNLIGTCRHNVQQRFRLWWSQQPFEDRLGVIEFFAQVPMYYNHSELSLVNQWALEAGCQDIPFKEAKPLPPDNGERFFGEYLVENKERSKFGVHRTTRRCMCRQCGGNPEPLNLRINPDSEEDEQETSEMAMPVGNRLADKPTKTRKRAAPAIIPPSLPKPRPVEIAPRPHNTMAPILAFPQQANLSPFGVFGIAPNMSFPSPPNPNYPGQATNAAGESRTEQVRQIMEWQQRQAYQQLQMFQAHLHQQQYLRGMQNGAQPP